MNDQRQFSRANGRIFETHAPHHAVSDTIPFPQMRISPEYLSGGRRSLPGISLHAFGLGIAGGICLVLAIQLAYWENDLWRIPAFITTLAIFHYLEFDMTARYNPPDAKVESFLLFSNGSAYNIAHTTAIFEVLLRSLLNSQYRPNWLRLPFTVPQVLPTVPSHVFVLAGIILVLVGQIMRSLAMKQAGTSFNHIVQAIKKEDHVLVTTGVYSLSRHPAYFGFFWWAIGTQLLLGNPFCFIVYFVILWKFFKSRILHEEKHLVQFFDEAYINYRKRTSVGIPFIR